MASVYESMKFLTLVNNVHAGVYRDPQKITEFPSFRDLLLRMVVVTSANFAFLNHVHNLRCYLERLGKSRNRVIVSIVIVISCRHLM